MTYITDPSDSQAENAFSGKFMEHSGSIKSGIHYHIRWSDSSLDWKPFPTEEEATELAVQISTRSQSYTIVERNDECERCKVFQLESASFMGRREVQDREEMLRRD